MAKQESPLQTFWLVLKGILPRAAGHNPFIWTSFQIKWTNVYSKRIPPGDQFHISTGCSWLPSLRDWSLVLFKGGKPISGSYHFRLQPGSPDAVVFYVKGTFLYGWTFCHTTPLLQHEVVQPRCRFITSIRTRPRMFQHYFDTSVGATTFTLNSSYYAFSLALASIQSQLRALRSKDLPLYL